MSVVELRSAITTQVQYRGPGWKASILRPRHANSISELNMAACRIIARLWCTVPPRYGVQVIEPGTVRDGVWL
jgi:hypothetical protein